MTVFHSRPGATPRLPFVRSAIACAVTGVLLGACQHGGQRVGQLSDLRGPTRDYKVEFHEGTNMALVWSPDGSRIALPSGMPGG